MKDEIYYCASCQTIFTERPDYCPNCDAPPEYPPAVPEPFWTHVFGFILYLGMILLGTVLFFVLLVVVIGFILN